MDEITRKKYWIEYSRSKSKDAREKLIVEYAPLVKLVAGRLAMYLGYNVEFEDLCSYGVLGLIDAIDKFDYSKEVKFETYASLRIRGSILDQIRKMDWIPRTIRQRQRKIDQISAQIEAETGRPATDEEIAKGLGISDNEYVEMQSQMKVTGLVSLDEFTEAGGDIAAGPSTQKRFETPERAAEKNELAFLLKEALEMLTEKERRVIELYYYEDLSVKEIGYALDVSESRVSQLHTKALSKMKTKMGDYASFLVEG